MLSLKGGTLYSNKTTALIILGAAGLRSRCINEGLPLGECTQQTLIDFISRQSLGTPAGENRKWTKSGPSRGYLHGCPTTQGQAAPIVGQHRGAR